jgi:hypothetical protein
LLMFCRKCGTQIPDDSVFCIKCGTPVALSPTTGGEAPAAVALSAEYLEVFQNVVAKDHFDLYVGYTRFVMIKVQSGGSGVGSLLGPVGSIMEMGVNIAKRKKYDDDLTLDQKLRRDKGSFAMDYVIVDSVKLGKGKLGGRIMQVRYADEKGAFKKIDITLNNAQFEKLEQLLPSLPALGPKFQLKA